MESGCDRSFGDVQQMGDLGIGVARSERKGEEGALFRLQLTQRQSNLERRSEVGIGGGWLFGKGPTLTSALIERCAHKGLLEPTIGCFNGT